MKGNNIDVLDITFGYDLSLFKAIILWHPKQIDQFKSKVADIIIIPGTIYLANGELIPKIKDKLIECQGRLCSYTLI